MIDNGDDIDLRHLRLIREGKEKSRALPQNSYGDPSRVAKFESEKMLAKYDMATVQKRGKR